MYSRDSKECVEQEINNEQAETNTNVDKSVSAMETVGLPAAPTANHLSVPNTMKLLC